MEIDERLDELGSRPSASGKRRSDKGFLVTPLTAYLELLDWTARQLTPRKRSVTPEQTRPMLERLKIPPELRCQLVSGFGRLFTIMASGPQRVDSYRCPLRGDRYHVRREARELLQP